MSTVLIRAKYIYIHELSNTKCDFFIFVIPQMSLMQFYLHLKLTLQWLDWEFGLADASYYIYII